MNAAIYEARKGLALKGVLADLRKGHEGLLKIARGMDERKLLTPGELAWAGPTWAVAHHLRANTAAHYRWAGKHFRACLKQQGSPATGPKRARKGGKTSRGSRGV